MPKDWENEWEEGGVGVERIIAPDDARKPKRSGSLKKTSAAADSHDHNGDDERETQWQMILELREVLKDRKSFLNDVNRAFNILEKQKVLAKGEGRDPNTPPQRNPKAFLPLGLVRAVSKLYREHRPTGAHTWYAECINEEAAGLLTTTVAPQVLSKALTERD